MTIENWIIEVLNIELCELCEDSDYELLRNLTSTY